MSIKKVLIADDSRDAADSLASAISALGHQAVAAYDGAQAVTAALEHEPDVAILDVQMPNMDGCAAAAEIRAQPHPPRVIASMTGMPRDQEPMRSRADVFDEHLSEPCDFNEIDDLLARADKR